MTLRWDELLIDCRLATMSDNGKPYGTIENAALGWKDGRIVFAEEMRVLPGPAEALAQRVESADNAWVTPGLIDCHTHLVFGGNRSAEFELRLEGASYSDIARAGGGIASSVRATRKASEEDLLAVSLQRASALMRDGVTTLEIKSGYGLDLESELKMLRVARRIGEILDMDVRTSFLGAHATPPEFADRQSDYIDYVCEVMLPAIAMQGLADAVDGFCETIGFTAAEIHRVFSMARVLGMPVKLHADQLTNTKSAALAAEFNALSADHLEQTDEAGVAAMAKAGTVAVLLPGAYYALRDTQLPPVAAMRKHKLPMAVATDLNPGTSPLLSLRLAMNMACTLFRLTPEESLRGTTVHAARALGLSDRGTLTPGQRSDFVVWDIERPADLSYWIGGDLVKRIEIAPRTESAPGMI